MVTKGFIKAVGQTREWPDKNGEKQQSVKLTLSVPIVTRDGQESEDVLLAEMRLPSQSKEFLEGLQKACEAHEKCEMHLGFFLSEWNGKQIQNIKVFSLTKMI